MVIRNLHASEIECRVARISDKGVELLLYKDARCDMNILDETFGIFGWKKEYSRNNANCIVSVKDPESGEWISKEDTGVESLSQKQKGLASDSFKRACVNFGIGRELYTAPDIYFPLKSTNGSYDPNTRKGKCYDQFAVSAIEYEKENGIELKRIRKVTVVDLNTNRSYVAVNESRKEPLSLEKEIKGKQTISKTKANMMVERLRQADPQIIKAQKLTMVDLTNEYHIESIEDLEETQYTDLSIRLTKAGL